MGRSDLAGVDVDDTGRVGCRTAASAGRVAAGVDGLGTTGRFVRSVLGRSVGLPAGFFLDMRAEKRLFQISLAVAVRSLFFLRKGHQE